MLSVGRANDIGQWVRDRWALQAIVAVVAGMLFLYLHLELGRTFLYFYPPLRIPVLSLLWIALCIFLLREYRLQPSEVLLGLLMLFVAGLVVKLFIFDLAGWQVMGLMRYAGDRYSFTLAAMRLLDFGVIIAFLYAAYYMLSGNVSARAASVVFAPRPWRYCLCSPPWRPTHSCGITYRGCAQAVFRSSGRSSPWA